MAGRGCAVAGLGILEHEHRSSLELSTRLAGAEARYTTGCSFHDAARFPYLTEFGAEFQVNRLCIYLGLDHLEYCFHGD